MDESPWTGLDDDASTGGVDEPFSGNVWNSTSAAVWGEPSCVGIADGATAELVDNPSGAGAGKGCREMVLPSEMGSKSNAGTGVGNLSAVVVGIDSAWPWILSPLRLPFLKNISWSAEFKVASSIDSLDKRRNSCRPLLQEVPDTMPIIIRQKFNSAARMYSGLGPNFWPH